VRENFALFVLAALAWIAWRSRRESVRPALGFAAGAALAILPATLHNVSYDGELIPITSQAGQNFYTGWHRGNPHGGYLVPDFVRRSPRFEETDFAREAERRKGRALTPGEVSRYWLREGLAACAADPWRTARLFGAKLALLYHRLEIPDDEDVRFFRRYAPLLRLPLPDFGVAGVLGLLGLAIAIAGRRAPPELVIFVLAYTVSVAAFFVFSRYRLPLVAPLAVFAGHALARAGEELARRRWRRLALGAAACVPLALAIHRPLDAGASFANSHLSVGIALEVKGDPGAALAEYRAGLALEPDHAKLLRRAARLLDARASGRAERDELSALLERAVQANPDDTELRFRWGALLGEAGRLEAAARQFEEILRRGDSPPGLHANLAIAYDRLNRPADAAPHARAALETAPNDPVMLEILNRSEGK
jgi:tetratricopeptide (TPR) repeat protein